MIQLVTEENQHKVATPIKTKVRELNSNGEFKSDLWRTPPKMIKVLEDKFGKFSCDLAANAQNAICENFIDLEDDSLITEWPEGLLFCNPPYSVSKLRGFIQEFALRDRDVITVIPNSVDSIWFHEWVKPFAKIYFVVGRIAFIDQDGVAKKSNPKGTLVCQYGPEIVPEFSDETFDAKDFL